MTPYSIRHHRRLYCTRKVYDKTILFISELKPKRLQIAKDVEGSQGGDLMGNCVESEVPCDLTTSLCDEDKMDLNHIEDQPEQSKAGSVTSEDKVFQAAKFLEQLKALLKLDDLEEMDDQDDSGSVSHSLQVSEVTSSNMNGIADGSSGTDSEPYVDVEGFDELDASAINSKSEIESTLSHKASFVTEEARNVNSKEFYSPAITKAGKSFDKYCTAKETGLLEQKQASKHSLVGDNGASITSVKNPLPANMFSCSLCKARFVSYSRLKRHKRVVHKLFNKAIESNPSKKSTSTDSKSFYCPFCFQKNSSLKSLQRHMCSTHHISRRASEVWMPFSGIQEFDTANCVSGYDLDIGARCVSFKSGQIECSLCGAVFLTFKGHKSHLKHRHKIVTSLSNGGQQQLMKSNPKMKSVESQHVAEAYSQGGGYNSEVSQFESQSGYDTDTETKCKKCDSTFDSVRKRREHELKSHGLKISFQGEQFAFLEIDMKVSMKDAGSSHGIDEEQRPVVDFKGKFFCKKTNSCKLCAAKYVNFSSLQRHMRQRHNIKAYKMQQFVYNQQKPKISECRADEMPSKSVGTADSKEAAPLSSSKAPKKEFGDVAKRTSPPCGDVLLCKGEQSGKMARRPTSKPFGSKNDADYLVINVQSQKAKDKQNEVETKSLKTEEVTMTQGRKAIDISPGIGSSTASAVSILQKENKEGREEKTHCSRLEESVKTNVQGEDEEQVDKYLWSTSFSRKRFSCLICDVSFSGYNIQRKHMLKIHNISLDNHGNRVIPSSHLNKNSPDRASGSDLLQMEQTREKNHDNFEGGSYHLPSPPSREEIIADPDCDNSQSSFVCVDENDNNDSYEVTMEDGSRAYLCTHCPLRFKSLIDRLIHTKDVHKHIATEVSHAITQSSSLSSNRPEVLSSESSSPKLNSAASKLQKQADIVNNVAQGKLQMQKEACKEAGSPPRKRILKEVPGIYHCHLCDNIYKYYRGVYKHVRRAHKAQPLSKHIYNKRNLSEGKDLVENPKCHLCNISFRAINQLVAHVKREHNTEAGKLKATGGINLTYKRDISAEAAIENSVANVLKKGLSRKRDRHNENVKSNLLAISIRDKPRSSTDSDNASNCNVVSNAEMAQDEDYVPVPPCDESELVSEDVEVVEDNFFSRLHLLTGVQRPIKLEETESLFPDPITRDVNKVSKTAKLEQSIGNRSNDMAAINVKKEKRSVSEGKICLGLNVTYQKMPLISTTP